MTSRPIMMYCLPKLIGRGVGLVHSSIFLVRPKLYITVFKWECDDKNERQKQSRETVHLKQRKGQDCESRYNMIQKDDLDLDLDTKNNADGQEGVQSRQQLWPSQRRGSSSLCIQYMLGLVFLSTLSFSSS